MASHDHPDLTEHDIYHVHNDETCNLVKKALDKFTARYDHGWYAPTPAPHHYSGTTMSTIDPMQLLATLAFVAFLLQSLMALIDRVTMTTRVTQARDDKKLDKAQEIVDSIRKFQAKKWEDKNV